MSSSAATARVAASSATRRSARPWTSARDQAASTASSMIRDDGVDGPGGRVEEEAAQVRVALVRPQRELREAARGPPRRGSDASVPAPTSRLGSGGRADLQHRTAGAGDLEDPLERATNARPGVRRSGRGASARAPRGRRRGGTRLVRRGGPDGIVTGRRSGGDGAAGAGHRPQPTSQQRRPGRRARAFGPLVTSHRYHRPRPFPNPQPTQTGAPMPADHTVVTPPAASPAEPAAGARRDRVQRDLAVAASSASPASRVAACVAASVAACAPAAAPAWSFGAPATPGAATAPAATPRRDRGCHRRAARQRRPRPRRHRPPRRPRPPRTSRPAGPSTTSTPATSSGATSATSSPALKDIYGARRLREARRDPRGRGRLPGAQREAGLRPGPAAGPERRAHAAQARDGRRRQGLPPDDRRDGLADRRAEAHRRGPRLQQAVARPDDPGDRGRQGPRHLQEQPHGDDRRPLPRRGVRRTSSRTASRSSPSCRSRRARSTRTSSWPTGPAR